MKAMAGNNRVAGNSDVTDIETTVAALHGCSCTAPHVTQRQCVRHGSVALSTIHTSDYSSIIKRGRCYKKKKREQKEKNKKEKENKTKRRKKERKRRREEGI